MAQKPPSAQTKAVVKKGAKKPVVTTAAAKEATSKSEAEATGAEKQKRASINYMKLLQDEGVIAAMVPNEADDVKRRRDLLRVIDYQNIAIAVLIGFLILGVPFFQPTYNYVAMRMVQNKQGGVQPELQQLVPLSEPNLTNQAILSWVTSAVTEVMTLGFGDFDHQLIQQRDRFTAKGWESFREALLKDNMRDVFKERQLVLTTVPSDAPVISAQGMDEKNVYVWRVELPIIMTYTTNNNVAQKARAIIALTITRVPTSENERGIAIKLWSLASG